MSRLKSCNISSIFDDILSKLGKHDIELSVFKRLRCHEIDQIFTKENPECNVYYCVLLLLNLSFIAVTFLTNFPHEGYTLTSRNYIRNKLLLTHHSVLYISCQTMLQ